MSKNMVLSHEANQSASFYEGGRFTLANRDFVNATSPFEDMAFSERDTMRARARWLHENNPIISNIDRTIVANVIGGGLKFQFKLGSETTDDSVERLNSEIELAWEVAKDELDIAGSVHFDELCKIALKNRFMDGECLFYLPIVETGFGEKELKIQPIEVDRFALGYVEMANGGFYDGVEVDKFGKNVAYHISDGAFEKIKIAGKSNKKISSSIKIPASNAIYYFKKDNRFSQIRGVSEYKQTIIDLKNFAAFMRSTIEGARSRANIAYVLKRQNPEMLRNLSEKPIEVINGIFVQNLRPTDTLEVLDPKIADDNFGAFVEAVLRLIASGRGVSYELASRDFSRVNYSGGRMSLLQDYKLFDDDLLHFSRNFYRPIFMRWLEFEALKGSFKYLSYQKFLELKNQIKASAILLYPPRREWVDPLKESKAIATELEYNTTTLSEIYARRGLDWREGLRQIAAEKDYAESLGLSRFNNAKLIVNTNDKEENDE